MLSNGNYNMDNKENPNTGIYVKGTDDPRILLYYNPISITNKYTGAKDEGRYRFLTNYTERILLGKR